MNPYVFYCKISSINPGQSALGLQKEANIIEQLGRPEIDRHPDDGTSVWPTSGSEKIVMGESLLEEKVWVSVEKEANCLKMPLLQML